MFTVLVFVFGMLAGSIMASLIIGELLETREVLAMARTVPLPVREQNVLVQKYRRDLIVGWSLLLVPVAIFVGSVLHLLPILLG